MSNEYKEWLRDTFFIGHGTAARIVDMIVIYLNMLGVIKMERIVNITKIQNAINNLKKA